MERQNAFEKHYPFTFRVNCGLLGSHIGLLTLFLYLEVYLMVYVNIGSVALYALLFFVYKKNLVGYVAVVFAEVLLHMSLATICLGWDTGFQFYSFCLLPCIFLCDYLAKTDHQKGMHPIFVSVSVLVTFLICREYCVHFHALYTLEDPVEYTMLFTYNMILSFAFLTIYLVIFENRILSKETVLENRADADELTSLPNRYLMQEWLSENFERAQKGMPMAIAMLDVDDFKKLNDVYGHNCGDLVLKSLAEKMRKHMDEKTYIARWGGEEFLFLSVGEDALESLTQILEELRQDMAGSAIFFEKQQIQATITAGVTAYDQTDTTFFDTIRRADEHMYQGKKKGKNVVVSK